MERGGVTYYYHADGLGSITELTDSTGSVVQSYAYDAWGNIVDQTGTVENPYTYTAREYDPETGLYYYRARAYDPSVGRFLQEDPIGLAGGLNLYIYVDSVGKPFLPETNLYQYAGNNPVNYTDPLGLFNILAGGGFSAVASVGAEASSGFVFNPGLFGQKADIGTFAAFGPGVGVNVSADLFVGFVRGGIENVQGETANINIVGGPFSLTLFTDPKTGDLVGLTVGVGPSATPIGASGSYSITRTLTLRDLLSRFFGPGGQILCGRKS